MSTQLDHKESLPTGLAGRINRVCDQFEAAWQAGERPKLEDFLPQVEAADRTALLRELLTLELHFRGRLGEQITAAEYTERFPEHADVIDGFCGSFSTPGPAGTSSPDERRTLPTQGSSVPASIPGYEILGELGCGGMGVVLEGRDPDLGRELAVKLLLDRHRESPEMVRRFVEEAQIGGQLQHPGVVPVYEAGRLSDDRPYFTMKLVEGRTLAQLLAERDGPAGDLPRFLKVFEQICQTVAYAHGRGVIHRDLKPLNVMVGAFGEVQVMDWGLAKVVKERGVRTVRSRGLENQSETGAVLGTPAYMAPEQACGDIDALDERCDVFGLGAVLCEILTGAPPYRDRGKGIGRQAAQADLADAYARLDGCGADADLLRLARMCLAAEPQNRPRDAAVVALEMSANLLGVQDRLHRAEVEAAAAEARAEAAQAKSAAVGLAEEKARAEAEAARRAADEARSKAAAARRARLLTAALASVIVLAAISSMVRTIWINAALKDEAAKTMAAMNQAKDEAAKAKAATEAADARATEAQEAQRKAQNEAAKTRWLSGILEDPFEDPLHLYGTSLLVPSDVGKKRTVMEILEPARQRATSDSIQEGMVRAGVLDAIGRAYFCLGDYDNAEKLLRQALLLREKNPNDPLEIAKSQVSLGRYYDEQGRLSEAAALYQEAMSIRSQARDDAGIIEIKLLQAYQERREENDKQAIALFTDVIALKHDNGDHDCAVARMGIAGVHFDQDDERGLPGLAAAMEPLLKEADDVDLTSGVDHFQRAYALARIPTHLTLTKAAYELDECKACFDRSLRLNKSGVQEHAYNAIVLYYSAVYMERAEQWQEAEMRYKECLDNVNGSVGLQEPMAIKLVEGYAGLWHRMGQDQKAHELFKNLVKAQRKRFKGSFLVANALFAYAKAIQAWGDAEKVRDLANEALEIFDREKDGPKKRHYVACLRVLAGADQKLGNIAEAEKLLQRIEQLAQQKERQ